jgi:hypothetical protein
MILTRRRRRKRAGRVPRVGGRLFRGDKGDARCTNAAGVSAARADVP